MNKTKRLILIIALLVILSALGIRHAVNIVKDGAQAYLYGYPLVLMDATRQTHTQPETGRGLVNHFAHVSGFPDHNFRQVVRPNNDTLYSNSWLDLTSEPLVLSVPDTAGRYYVMPFMDAWTNVFASVGSRITGTETGDYLVAGPNWHGETPSDLKLIRSPTNISWLIGRIQTNGKKDFSNVHNLQRQFFLTPLSRWGRGNANPGFFITNDNQNIASENPSARVKQMPAGEFFAHLCRLMGFLPPAEADGPVLQILAKFGMSPGKVYDIEQLGVVRRFLLKKAVEISRQKLSEMSTQDRSSENNWAVVREGIGVYGTAYNIRAFVALIGLGALTPAEAAYPNSQLDQNGDPLSGQHRYRIHFEAGQTPPVDAFWSLTMYNEQGFLIDNPIRRYALGDRDELQYNSDGSLDIFIQHQQLTENESNWLPAPAGKFAVTMRLYLPKAEFLSGAWQLPFIEKIDSP